MKRTAFNLRTDYLFIVCQNINNYGKQQMAIFFSLIDANQYFQPHYRQTTEVVFNNMENNQMITVDEFMTTEPCTLRDTDTINDARQIMTEKHIRHIPITDSEDHVLGLVTQRDVLAVTGPASAKSDSNEAKADVKLSEIMIRNVSIVHPSDSIRQAALYLQAHKYGCLPVVSDDCLVGIITDSDFIAIAINLLEQAELSEDVLGAEMDDVDLLVVDEAL